MTSRKRKLVNTDAAEPTQGPSKRQQQILGRQDSSYRRRYDVLNSALALSDKKLPYEILELITEQSDPCGSLTAFDCFSSSRVIQDPFADEKSGVINCSKWCWDNCHEFLEFFLEELPLEILHEAKIDPNSLDFFTVGMFGPGMWITRNVIRPTRAIYYFNDQNLNFHTDNIQAMCAEMPENFRMFLYTVTFRFPSVSLPLIESRDVLRSIKSKYPQFMWNVELYNTRDGYVLNLDGTIN